MSHRYTMDVKVFAGITVAAKSENEAQAKLRALFSEYEANFGMLDGDPVVVVVGFDGAEVREIDGEAV